MARQKIVKGSDATIVVKLKDRSCSNDSCKPFPLSDFQGATAQFLNEDDTILSVAGTLLSEDNGSVQFDLDRTETELLQENEMADFVLFIDLGVGVTGTRVVKNVEGKIGIYDRVF